MKRITFFLMMAALSFHVAEAATTFVPGVLQEEYWAGKLKDDIAAGTAGTPTFTTNLTSFEIPSDIANNYAVRVSGFFIPAASGNYSFNISADDTADLFLSTDDNPANKRMIAQQPGWNATRLWVTDSGGGNDCSKEFRAPGGTRVALPPLPLAFLSWRAPATTLRLNLMNLVAATIWR